MVTSTLFLHHVTLRNTRVIELTWSTYQVCVSVSVSLIVWWWFRIANHTIYAVWIFTWSLRIFNIDAFRSCFTWLARVWRRFWLGSRWFWNVSRIKELSKEYEIAEVHPECNVDVEICRFNSAIAIPAWICWHTIVYEDIHTHTENHLHQLKRSDENIDPNWWTVPPRRAHSIIKIHDCMYEVVHWNKPLCQVDNVAVMVPAVYEDCDVVVPV